ncbi:MAG: hypothetical protein KGR24_10415 [Planctomycetes bacterium]|nr:hypothetical protein [Planctomycetota bacterium]
MDARDLSGAIVEAMTPSRWQLVWFVVVFVQPWVIGVIHMLAQAVRFAFRVWGWLT